MIGAIPKNLTPEILKYKLKELMNDEARLQGMQVCAKKLEKKNVLEEIAKEINKVLLMKDC